MEEDEDEVEVIDERRNSEGAYELPRLDMKEKEKLKL